MHQTQADASYFGIKRLDEFPFESYLIEYNSSDAGDYIAAFLHNNTAEPLPSTVF